MPDYLYVIIASVIAGVILLFIEYHSGWFQKRFRVNKPRQRHSEDEIQDWSQALHNVRGGLHRITGAWTKDIEVLDWKTDPHEKHLYVILQVSREVPGTSPAQYRNKWYKVTAGPEGNILNCDETNRTRL